MDSTENPNQEQELEEEILYQCLNCRANWDIDEVQIFESAGTKKYICPDCRSKCLPRNELNKKTGVKSINQKFRKKNFFIYIFIGALSYITYLSYQGLSTISDYNIYLSDTANIRKKINSKLTTFKKDYLTIKNKKSNARDIIAAKNRISDSTRYILTLSDEIDKIQKPDKEEIIKLYEIDKKFISNPNYENYVIYSSTFNDLKKRYNIALFESVKEIIKKRLEKIQKNK